VGTQYVLLIPADAGVVWGDGVTLTTENILFSGLVPASLWILRTELFLLDVHWFCLAHSASWTSTDCPGRATKRSPSRKMDDRLPRHMCVTFACQIPTALYFPLEPFLILQPSFSSAGRGDPNQSQFLCSFFLIKSFVIY